MTSHVRVETPLRISRTFSAAWWGFLGPLILLLNATAVPVLEALRLSLVLILLSVGGIVAVHITGLNRIECSVISQLLLGLSLALGLVALFTQFLGLVARNDFNWLVVLAVMQLPLIHTPTRQQIRKNLIEQPVLSNHELPALWFLIFGVLTTSSHIFTIGAVLVLVSYLALQLKRGASGRSSWLQYVPIWISVIGVYLVSVWLGWIQQSPWAFSLRSLDNVQWVAMAWSVDAYGWTADPTAPGVPMSYHFLAQAMAGLLSRTADISLVASVVIIVPIIAVAGGYMSLRTYSAQRLNSTAASWIPAVAGLACFGPWSQTVPFRLSRLPTWCQ